jgi:hypothetical protein
MTFLDLEQENLIQQFTGKSDSLPLPFCSPLGVLRQDSHSGEVCWVAARGRKLPSYSMPGGLASTITAGMGTKKLLI